MKHFRDIYFEVELWDCSNGWFWKAYYDCRVTFGLEVGNPLAMEHMGYATRRGCLNNWKCFAKIYGIKKWKLTDEWSH